MQFLFVAHVQIFVKQIFVACSNPINTHISYSRLSQSHLISYTKKQMVVRGRDRLTIR
jgi:hypothetical protein